MTLQQLAELSRVSYAYIGQVERGKGNASVDVLEKLAGALRVNVAAFFAFGDIPDEALLERFKEVPLLTNFPSSQPTAHVVSVGGYPILAQFWKKTRYALRIHDQTVPPTVIHNDVVLVEYGERSDREGVKGQICVVWLGDRHVLGRPCLDGHDKRGGWHLVISDKTGQAIDLSKSPGWTIQGTVIMILERMVRSACGGRR